MILNIIRFLNDYLPKAQIIGASTDGEILNDEVLKESFSLFILGLLEKLPIDKFLDNYVEEENSTDDYDMFFTDFKDEIDELIIKHVETFKKEFSE